METQRDGEFVPLVCSTYQHLQLQQLQLSDVQLMKTIKNAELGC